MIYSAARSLICTFDLHNLYNSLTIADIQQPKYSQVEDLGHIWAVFAMLVEEEVLRHW